MGLFDGKKKKEKEKEEKQEAEEEIEPLPAPLPKNQTVIKYDPYATLNPPPRRMQRRSLEWYKQRRDHTYQQDHGGNHK